MTEEKTWALAPEGRFLRTFKPRQLFRSLLTPDGISIAAKSFPQRLKPMFCLLFYGTAEAVPFQNELLTLSAQAICSLFPALHDLHRTPCRQRLQLPRRSLATGSPHRAGRRARHARPGPR